MIEAKDLVVGNYYKADIQFPKGSIEAKVGFGEDRIFQFTEHVAKVVFTSYSTGLDLKMFINPIPLTEEWLYDFDFVNKGYEWIKIDDDDFSFICEGDIEDGIRFTDGECVKFGTPCIYVHQLQNLYRALTSEELTLRDLTK